MKLLDLTVNEFKNLFSNRLSRVAVFVVCGIPLLYSFLYLYAFWDPYGKLDKLPIAVVNQDSGAVMDGTSYNFGDKLVDGLHKNDNAEWNFVSEEDAQYGLDHKKYYIEVRVPTDFSRRVLSVSSNNPRSAEIQFIANPGSNYLASQIGSRIMTEVKDSMAGQISQNYVQNIFVQVSSSAKGLKKAADASGQLASGSEQALKGNHDLTQGLQKAIGANQTVETGTARMAKGAGQLYTGLNQASSGTETIAAKSGDAQKGLDSMGSGLQAAKSGSALLADKLKEAATGEQSVQQGLSHAYDGSSKISAGASSLNDGLQKVSNGVGAVSKGLNKMASSVDEGTNRLSSGSKQLADGTEKLSGSLNQVDTGIGSMNSGVNNAQLALKRTEQNLEEYVSAHPEAASDPKMMTALATLKSVNGGGGLGAVSSGLQKTHEALSGQIIPAVGQVNDGQQQLTAGIGDLRTKLLQSFRGGTDTTALIPGTDALKQSLDKQIIPGSEQIADKTRDLASGLKQLSAGTNSLYNGLLTAAYKTKELSEGAAKMESGNAALAGGVKQLRDNLQLLSGSLQKMAAGAGDLNSGLQKTSSGLRAVNNGFAKVEKGQNNLGTGLQNLKKGQFELKSELASAAEKAANSADPDQADKKARIIAQPLNVKDESIHQVDSYGSGFAPYFIPLSLWVGALMIFFVINPKYSQELSHNKVHMALGKYCTVASISTAQALVTSFVIRNILHLPVTDALSFYLFNVFQSLVYVAIIQFLVTTFGIAGRFMGLLFLMLQLTSAGGTFPIELVPRFFQVLNPALPMSYGVSGLREIISGANSALFPKSILALFLFGVFFLTMTVVSYISPFFAKLNAPDQVAA